MEKKSKNNKDLRMGLIGLVVALIIVFVIGLFCNQPESIPIQGEVEATEVRISSMVPARVKQLKVEEGNQVHVGDTLVILDSPELEAQLMQADAAEKAAMAQNLKAIHGARKEQIAGAYDMWQKAEVGVEIAKKSFDRMEHLYEKGVIPAQKRDEVEAQYHAAVATAKAAKSQYDMALNGTQIEDKEAALALVNRAKGAVQEVKAFLNETCLTSPINGEVSEIFPERGELVGSGAPIMTIVDLSDCWFTFNIQEDLMPDFKIGTIFTVKVPALGNQLVKVRVNFIKPLASYATWRATKTTGQFDTRTFEVHARPLTAVAGLRPGMSGLLNKTIK
jgi:HlyD family secretion protein